MREGRKSSAQIGNKLKKGKWELLRFAEREKCERESESRKG